MVLRYADYQASSDLRRAHVLTDMSGAFLSVDDTYCDIVGRERSELIGRRAIEFTNPVEQPLHAAAIGRLRDNGKSLIIRKQYVRGDGGLIAVENEASVVHDGVGPKRLIATIRVVQKPTPISLIEIELSIARMIAREALSRRNRFTKANFCGDKWSLLLACFVLECQGRPTLISNVCYEAHLSEDQGVILLLEIISTQDMEFERAGSTLNNSSIRISFDLSRMLSQHFAGVAATSCW